MSMVWILDFDMSFYINSLCYETKNQTGSCRKVRQKAHLSDHIGKSCNEGQARMPSLQ